MDACCGCGWTYQGTGREADQAARAHAISNRSGHVVTVGELEYRRVMNDVHVVDRMEEIAEERLRIAWEQHNRLMPTNVWLPGEE
jgi:hypothetical protein